MQMYAEIHTSAILSILMVFLPGTFHVHTSAQYDSTLMVFQSHFEGVVVSPDSLSRHRMPCFLTFRSPKEWRLKAFLL